MDQHRCAVAIREIDYLQFITGGIGHIFDILSRPNVSVIQNIVIVMSHIWITVKLLRMIPPRCVTDYCTYSV